MAGLNLFQAAKQWAERPNDERFWSLAEAHAATKAYADASVTKPVEFGQLRVEANDGEIQLLGKSDTPARLTYHAFDQLAMRARAPAAYLRRMPATLAAQNINWGLRDRSAEDQKEKVNLLLHKNGSLLLRAATTEKYTRIWNHEIFARLRNLESKGWRVPPARPSARLDARARPATRDDVLAISQRALMGGLAVKVGDMIAPSGVYASDHDMFCFLVNEERPISDGRGGVLGRGFFVWNGEVGGKSLGGMTFLYAGVCGNHIVWGAEGITEFKIRHVKSSRNKWDDIGLSLAAYTNRAASADEKRIKAAQVLSLGKGRAEVVETVSTLCRSKRIALTGPVIDAAYTVAEERVERYGAPNTAWAMVNGLTEHSQTVAFADERDAIDRASGKLLAAFDF